MDGLYGTLAGIVYKYGISTSNNYEVKFQLDTASRADVNPGGRNATLRQYIEGVVPNVNNTTGETRLYVSLDETSLPGKQFATETINGSRMGQRMTYPHTPMYSDISFTFICDKSMYALKFLTAWMDYIGGEVDAGGNWLNLQGVASSATNRGSTAGNRGSNRYVRMAYPNSYMVDAKIIKTERGKDAPNQYAPIGYILNRMYPYSIESIPLSYGTTQLVKVTANFYYENWQMQYVTGELNS